MKIDFGFHSKGSPQFAFKHLDFTDGQGRGRGLPSYRGRGEQKRGKDWVKEGFSNSRREDQRNSVDATIATYNIDFTYPHKAPKSVGLEILSE